MAMRRVINKTFALGAATACPRHLRACARFINEYKPIRIKLRLHRFPVIARFRHVFAMLLAGVQRFFYN